MDDSSFFLFVYLSLCFFRFAQMQHTKLGAEIRASLIIFVGMVSNENRSIFPFSSVSCFSHYSNALL